MILGVNAELNKRAVMTIRRRETLAGKFCGKLDDVEWRTVWIIGGGYVGHGVCRAGTVACFLAGGTGGGTLHRLRRHCLRIDAAAAACPVRAPCAQRLRRPVAPRVSRQHRLRHASSAKWSALYGLTSGAIALYYGRCAFMQSRKRRLYIPS